MVLRACAVVRESIQSKHMFYGRCLGRRLSRYCPTWGQNASSPGQITVSKNVSRIVAIVSKPYF